MLRPQSVLAQLLPVVCELIEILVVFESLAEEDVHDREREQAVGAGTDREVLSCQRGSACAGGIDENQLPAMAPRLCDEGPQVHVAPMHVAARHNDEAGERAILRGRAESRSVDTLERRGAGGGANRPVELRGAEPIEEAAIHGTVPELADRASVAVRENALRPKLGGDLLQPSRNLVERLVPGDALEELGLAAF